MFDAGTQIKIKKKCVQKISTVPKERHYKSFSIEMQNFFFDTEKVHARRRKNFRALIGPLKMSSWNSLVGKKKLTSIYCRCLLILSVWSGRSFVHDHSSLYVFALIDEFFYCVFFRRLYMGYGPFGFLRISRWSYRWIIQLLENVTEI